MTEQDLADDLEQELARKPAPPPAPPTVLQRTSSSLDAALASLVAHRADLDHRINDLYRQRIEADRAILALRTAMGVIGQ